jgi:hypothetical protein
MIESDDVIEPIGGSQMENRVVFEVLDQIWF